MKQGFEKYVPFTPVDLPSRKWPGRVIEQAPTWCSVDLRDGNQALVDPMNLPQKLEFFHALCAMGFKEIEVGFPSASETEFEICRTLIEDGHIPDDVTIQVLVQAREHLIRRTFEAVRGAKHVILHFYNSTSTLQRKVVFHKDMAGIIDIAVAAAKLTRDLAAEAGAEADGGMDIRFEYSPESFSGTEPDNAVAVCAAVLDALGATPERPVILNLPSTVEMCTPNTYADQIEYFIKNLPRRERAIISVHPHNDRGTGIACGELALLAGATRVEGTLFGNGERTGNLDIVTMGLNMFTQGIDPGLDFSHLPRLRELYERTTGMRIPERQPYAGELVFTAFSGSHQDAIQKGVEYSRHSDSDAWEVPYLPIDPADIGRQYEPIIRINSQSGKGGAAFVMQTAFGYTLPKAMHPEFGAYVKAKCDEVGRELAAQELFQVFETQYRKVPQAYALDMFSITERDGGTHFEGMLRVCGEEKAVQGDGAVDETKQLSGDGNGPLDAFFQALRGIGLNYTFESYHEHALSSGSSAQAVAYIELCNADGKHIFGVGVENNINHASIQGVLCAINRDVARG